MLISNNKSGKHDNNTRYALEEVLEFDRAIQVAINATNNETLKIVTADHNTGGLTINGYSRSSNIRGEKLLGNVYGGSGDRSYLTWATGPGEKSPLKAPKHMEASHQHKATAHMKKSAHTAVDVPILSSGRGAINLSGYMHNSDIPHRILMAMGLRFSSPINIANYLDKTKKKKE